MKISVITACYNSAATIGDTLRSIAEQTHPDIEHIVVDGGSQDMTMEIVRVKGAHVAHAISEPDQGIYDAMNKGIRLATGEIVGLLNSDDFYASPEVLTQVARVFADPRIEASWGDLCYVGQTDTSKIVRFWKSSPFTPGLFARGWCPPHPTFFVRRAVYERYGAFDLRYRIAADVELMARLLEVNKVRGAYIPQILVRMRMGGASNRSLRNTFQLNQEIWRAFRHHRLSTSIWAFVGGKLLSRGWQFISKPSA